MPAYVVALIDVSDPDRFAAYQAQAFPVVERHGGTVLASSTAPVVLEGELRPQRMVIVAFDTVAECRAFYDSEDYQATLKTREGAAVLRILAVEGLP